MLNKVNWLLVNNGQGFIPFGAIEKFYNIGTKETVILEFVNKKYRDLDENKTEATKNCVKHVENFSIWFDGVELWIVR